MKTLAIVFKASDAYKLKNNGLNTVYPCSKECVNLLNQFLKVNTGLKVLSNSVLWGRAELPDVENLRKQLQKVLADLNTVADVIYKESQKYKKPKKEVKS